METLGLFLLEPPYRGLAPAGRRLPALGAVVLSDLRLGAVASANLSRFVHRAPWCPACATVPARRITAELLDALDQLPGACPKIVCKTEFSPVDPGTLLDVIARRPQPAVAELAAYAAGRLGRAELTATLVACFGQNGSSRSTLSRRLRDIPPLTAHDWEAIGHLALMFTSASRSTERLARDNHLDPRTIRAWTTRYLSVSWEDARGLQGWEWVLESALRRWGYVSTGVATDAVAWT